MAIKFPTASDLLSHIKKLIARKGISPLRMSRLAGLHYQTVYLYLRGDGDPKLSTIHAMLAALEKLPDAKK